MRSTSPRRSAGIPEARIVYLEPDRLRHRSPCPRSPRPAAPDALARMERSGEQTHDLHSGNFMPMSQNRAALADHLSQQATSHFFVDLWHFVSCPSGIYVALASGNSSPFPKCSNWHCSCFSPALSGSSGTGVRSRGGQGMVRGRILTPQIDSRSLMSEELLMLAVHRAGVLRSRERLSRGTRRCGGVLPRLWGRLERVQPRCGVRTVPPVVERDSRRGTPPAEAAPAGPREAAAPGCVRHRVRSSAVRSPSSASALFISPSRARATGRSSRARSASRVPLLSMTTSACAARCASSSWARIRAAMASRSRPRCATRRCSTTSGRAVTSHTSSTSASHFASTSNAASTTTAATSGAASPPRLGRDRIANQRMHDGVQARQLAGIGEDDGAEALAVDRAVGADDVGSELGDDLVPTRRTRRVGLVADAVGVDHQRAELGAAPAQRRSCRSRSRR